MADDIQLTQKLSQRRIIVELKDTATNSTYIVNEKQNIAEVQVSWEKCVGGLGKAQILIFNLNPYIVSTFTTKDYYPEKKKEVKIYAGYEDRDTPKTKEELTLLYEGEILFAKLTQGRPDTIFSITAMELFSKMNEDINLSEVGLQDNMTILDMVVKILEKYKFNVDISVFEWLMKNNTAIALKYYTLISDGYMYSGKLGNFLQKELFKFRGMRFIQDGMNIKLLPNDLDYKVYLSNMSSPALENANKVISGRVNGVMATMIGIPNPNFYGVELKTLFSEKVKAGEQFLLKSRVFATGNEASSYNIPYEITSVSYNLQLRGQDFYQNIRAIRFVKDNNSSTSQKNSVLSSTLNNLMSNPPRTFLETAHSMADATFDGMQVRVPCVVESVNNTTNTATVSIPIKKISSFIKNGERELIEYQYLRNIPIKMPAANGCVIRFPVVEGTTGWVVASDLDAGVWRNSDKFPEGGVEPRTYNFHQFAWGYFEPEIILPKGFSITNGGDNGICIQSLDGTGGVVINPDGTLIINAKSLTINGNTTINGTLTNNNINVSTHVHQCGDSMTGGMQN